MSEIIEISDDENFDFGTITRDDSDDDVFVLEEPTWTPASSVPPSSLPPSSQEQVYDISDLDVDDDELPDASKIIQDTRNRYSTDSPPGSLKRNSYLSEVDDLPKPKTNRRRRKTDEEKALDQVAKELEKAKKKAETQRKRAEAAAKKAEEKAAHMASKAVNKLVVDKKSTLKDMIVELSPGLVDSFLYHSLKRKMAEYGSRIQPMCSSGGTPELVDINRLKALNINIIRWKRHVTAIYNESQRRWIPLPEEQHHLRPEGTYLIYVTGDDLVNALGHNPTVPSLDAQVSMLRKILGPKYHIHLMLCGWRGKTNITKILDHVQTQLVSLQVKENIFVEEVNNIDDAVTWIYNISADLGIKPYKLIERSHLPFCPLPSGSTKAGKTNIDTFEKMLAQLPRLSETSARAIVKKYGTINNLMTEYQKAEPRGEGPLMLANVVISGGSSNERGRILNKALSERLYHVLWGSDPKVLVN
ncbi:hypothetical protein Clacol_004945 [Clathrus columnatus]|uniref:Crossover junction endonuclease EME1 n=1 Tax=Clathrus columnatus TaxID=1419009 RepID=A0AAV5AC43_9AGAM|nr:hypothetical protein Clacol_004945 [Clathrus columnatus]